MGRDRALADMIFNSASMLFETPPVYMGLRFLTWLNDEHSFVLQLNRKASRFIDNRARSCELEHQAR